MLLLALPTLALAAAAPDLDRARADVAWLVEEIGPRPGGSSAERRAVLGIAERLRAAGWSPDTMGCGTCLVACRSPDGHPTARRLFLAHPDTVPDSPGAVDNAAGVAALLEVARTTAADDLCLGFPPEEETGLVGAQLMARAWPEPLPELVVALDLTGQGRLSVTGLGPAWSGPWLAWLVGAADVHSPFAYRVVSRALPLMERSDHLPFALRGARSLHLLGRGEGGIFPRYHQPEDTEVEPGALADLVTALDGLATAPLPAEDGGPDVALPLWRWVLPAPAVWALLGLGGLSGLYDLRRPGPALRGLLASLGRALLATAVAAAALGALTLTGLLAPSTAEQTAAAVMGVDPTGWWAGALPGLVAGWAAFLALRRLLGGHGSAPLAATVLGALALAVDPLLALPFAVAALLTRLHPLLGLLPALYLLSPDHLRELAFHGLLPPAAWGALWLLAWPAFGAYSPPRRTRP